MAARIVYGVDPMVNTQKILYIWARNAIYAELRRRKFSLHYIANKFGKTHATVLNGLKKHERLIGNDVEYKMQHDRFLSEIGHKVKAKPVSVVEFRKFDNKTQKLKDLLDQVPEHQIENVFVKLEAIVRMSKVVHEFK